MDDREWRIQNMVRDMANYREQLGGLGASMYALRLIREYSQDAMLTADEFGMYVGETLAALDIVQAR